MRKYNQLNDVVLSGNGGICPVEKDQTMSTIVWAKKSVHLHKWSFLYLEFWLEFSEVSTKFLRLGFLLRFVPFILQIDWSCWLQIKSHPIIWWLLNEVSGQLCTIIIRQKKKLCIPILGNRSWILGRLCSFACRLWAQPSRSNFGTNMSECPISPSISSSLTMAVWAFWPPPSRYLLFVAAQAVECICWPQNFKMVTADVLPRQNC